MKTLPKFNNLSEDLIFDTYKSPIGKLIILANKEGLHALIWESEERKPLLKAYTRNKNHQFIKLVKKQLDEYFVGERKKFEIPLIVHGTSFQESAWKTLKKIPYGKTISYQEQAVKLGDKNKVRAVGGANGKNPFSIVIPCHRVIAKNGALHGYTGGLDKKQYLLNLEKNTLGA